MLHAADGECPRITERDAVGAQFSHTVDFMGFLDAVSIATVTYDASLTDRMCVLPKHMFVSPAMKYCV